MVVASGACVHFPASTHLPTLFTGVSGAIVLSLRIGYPRTGQWSGQHNRKARIHRCAARRDCCHDEDIFSPPRPLISSLAFTVLCRFRRGGREGDRRVLCVFFFLQRHVAIGLDHRGQHALLVTRLRLPRSLISPATRTLARAHTVLRSAPTVEAVSALLTPRKKTKEPAFLTNTMCSRNGTNGRAAEPIAKEA